MAWVATGVAVGSLALGSYSANEQGKAAKKAAKVGRSASDAQVALGREQLDYLKEQDALKQGLGTEWYDYQRGIAEEEDARRFGLLPQIQDNAQAALEESMANAGLFYDEVTGLAYDADGQMVGNAAELYNELTGNAEDFGGAAMEGAYGYQEDILGNADRMYDELTDNARYSDADYQSETDLASSDVVQSFNKARDVSRRNMLRYGANPNSSDFARLESRSALDQAAAEAGAMNTTRRGMKSEERDRLDSAISRGLTARGNAISSGYGATDNATRYAGGMLSDAFTTGRGAMDSAIRGGTALKTSAVGAGRAALDNAIRYGRGKVKDAMMTNLGTRSDLLSIPDPRLGMLSQTNSGYSNVNNAYANQAANAASAAAQHSANATNAMTSAGQTAGQIAGYYMNRPPTPTPTPAPAPVPDPVLLQA